MKKLVGILAVALSLVSCTAEPLPSNIQVNDPTLNTFAFDWESNQVEPYLYFENMYYVNGHKVSIKDSVSTKEKHVEVQMHNGDVFMVGINYKASAPRPLVRLKISRRKPMNLQSGAYTPEFETLYDKSAESNAFGYSGFVTNEGKLKD